VYRATTENLPGRGTGDIHKCNCPAERGTGDMSTMPRDTNQVIILCTLHITVELSLKREKSEPSWGRNLAGKNKEDQ